ncbi:hypothetical protein Dimus_015612 [Dionaea muscipula]
MFSTILMTMEESSSSIDMVTSSITPPEIDYNLSLIQQSPSANIPCYYISSIDAQSSHYKLENQFLMPAAIVSCCTSDQMAALDHEDMVSLESVYGEQMEDLEMDASLINCSLSDYGDGCFSTYQNVNSVDKTTLDSKIT